MSDVIEVREREDADCPRDIGSILTQAERFPFEIVTPSRVWLLLAQSGESRRMWIEGIRAYVAESKKQRL